MTQFMILLRNETVDFDAFSPKEYQKLVQDFEKWNASLAKADKLIGSANLQDDKGKTLRQQEGQLKIDGPYCETKEAVAGFFLIRAADYDEAIELAKGCPFLPIGGSVEVREAPHVEIEGLEPMISN